MYTRFEWDLEKAASNLKEHGITFTAAIGVFQDDLALTTRDSYYGVEERWQRLGTADGSVLLLVIYTLPSNPDSKQPYEIIRIISARRAERRERRRYNQQVREL